MQDVGLNIATLRYVITRVSSFFESPRATPVNMKNAGLKIEDDGAFVIALNHMPHGLCMFSHEKKLILCNSVYARMYALPGHLTLRGVSLQDILDHRQGIGNGPAKMDTYYDVVAASTVIGGVASRNIPLADGRVIRISHSPLDTGGYVATHEDVTENVRAEEQITHMARHDPLTGLPNRRLLREKLDFETTRQIDGKTEGPIEGKTGCKTLAVLYLDLDRFKEVNDTFGHAVGDLLLKAVTARLKNCLRKDDVIARLGGDEFAIIQTGVQTREQTEHLAQRLVAALGRTFKIDGHVIRIGVSIGIAMAPDDSCNADVLLRYADTSLYAVKSRGRNNYRFFEPAMDAGLQERRKLEGELRQALLSQQLEIYYQVEVDAQSQSPVGFEALLRWNHPDRGLLLPGDFLQLAEETALIVPIGEWVLRQACQDAMTWPRNITVAVNLSAFQFRSSTLAHTVLSALAASGLPAPRLELEITEAALLNDRETTLQTLHDIKTLGVRITMDDFGIGYSSLNYLRLFPFAKIKIDRSFIHELGRSADSDVIIKAVVDVGTKLGFSTTAEGVETAEQSRLAMALGCTEVQGYLVGKPQPLGQVNGRFHTAFDAMEKRAP